MRGRSAWTKRLTKRAKAPAKRRDSSLELQLALQLDAMAASQDADASFFNRYHREYKFDLKRRWRFDFAWLTEAIAVEVEGGHWAGGRHTRGSGFDADCEKYAAAAAAGWAVLRVTSTHIKSGEAIKWLKAMMLARV